MRADAMEQQHQMLRPCGLLNDQMVLHCGSIYQGVDACQARSRQFHATAATRSPLAVAAAISTATQSGRFAAWAATISQAPAKEQIAYGRWSLNALGMNFTAEEIDYLDTKAEGDALRAKQGNGPDEGQPAPQAKPVPAKGSKGAKGRKATATHQAELDERGDPIPF